jgi:GNAT superfamily N-acetyltransferase
VLYRQAEPGDIPAMARIRASKWGAPEYWEQRIAGYLTRRLNPQAARESRSCCVALDKTALVGFAAGHLTTRYACQGELQWINVARDSRRIGVASELLRWMARWFASNGAFRICVDADPEDAVARAFYTRFGAEPLGRHWLVWNDIRTILTVEHRPVDAPEAWSATPDSEAESPDGSRPFPTQEAPGGQ